MAFEIKMKALYLMVIVVFSESIAVDVPRITSVRQTWAGQVEVSWKVKRSKGITFILDYLMTGEQPEQRESVFSNDTTSKILTGLREFTNYSLTVEALSSDGSTATSTPHRFFVREGIPWRPTNISLQKTIDPRTVVIAWSCRENIGGGVDHFNLVLEGEENVTRTQTDQKQLRIAELVPNLTYTVRINGVNRVGNGPTAHITFSTFPVPTILPPTEEPLKPIGAAPRMDMIDEGWWITTTVSNDELYLNDEVVGLSHEFGDNLDERQNESSDRIMELMIYILPPVGSLVIVLIPVMVFIVYRKRKSCKSRKAVTDANRSYQPLRHRSNEPPALPTTMMTSSISNENQPEERNQFYEDLQKDLQLAFQERDREQIPVDCYQPRQGHYASPRPCSYLYPSVPDYCKSFNSDALLTRAPDSDYDISSVSCAGDSVPPSLGRSRPGEAPIVTGTRYVNGRSIPCVNVTFLQAQPPCSTSTSVTSDASDDDTGSVIHRPLRQFPSKTNPVIPIPRAITPPLSFQHPSLKESLTRGSTPEPTVLTKLNADEVSSTDVLMSSGDDVICIPDVVMPEQNCRELLEGDKNVQNMTCYSGKPSDYTNSKLVTDIM